MRSRRDFLKGAGTLALVLAAAARRARGQSASTVMILEDESVSTSAAKWISPSTLTCSSLEAGRIGYLCAWGGSPFGYGYSYSVSSGPADIDADTGALSLPTPVAPGKHAILVKTTNRDDPSKAVTFSITLDVRKGVTLARTGNQILHKTYRPESFGSPRGTNYTLLLLAMQKQILADQSAAGDGNLRALVQFTRGKTYEYTNNQWMTGVQYYRVEATGSGANPILRNTLGDTHSFYNSGPLNIGGGSAIDHQGSIKASCARINDAKMGDTQVTLMNAADASKIKPGRWHAVISGSQQLAGYPPNMKKIDYAIVTVVGGNQVRLDRPLRYSHNHDEWEDPNDDNTMGQARLVPWDCGGLDGAFPSDPRCTLRGQWVDITFRYQTVKGKKLDIVLAGTHIDLSFENCNIPNAQLSASKNILLSGCTLPTHSEPDKLSEQLVMDKCVCDEVLWGATGFQYFLVRDSTTRCVQVSPRQFRCIGSKIDATGDANFGVPFSIAGNGPLLEYEFAGTNFVAAGSQNWWTWGGNPPTNNVSLPLSAASWSGNRLIIPRSLSNFDAWMTRTYEGMMLTTATTPLELGSYGRIDRLYSPGDGSAIWAEVTWIKGSKPTSGKLYMQASRRLVWGVGNQITGGGTWVDPGFLCQRGTPADRQFPDGIS